MLPFPSHTRLRPSLRPAAGVLFVLSVLCVLPSCAPGGRAGPGGGFTMPPMPVEVDTASARVIRDRFRALGSLESDEQIQVVSEINAIVKALPFQEGGGIAKGAVLVRLDDREIRANANRAEAQHDKAKADFERVRKLAEQQVASDRELDDSRALLRIAESDAALANARLTKTTVRAPFAGMVGRRRVSVGAYVQSGDIITELARVDAMRVKFTAPERFSGQLRDGSAVEISTPAFPGRTFAGRVIVVDPIVDPQSRTFSLVARVPNPGRVLKPGMSADVAVTLEERKGALSIADEAVFAEGDGNFVFVVGPDSVVAKTAISLGTRDANHVEVTQGLSPGALVVRAGHQKLFPGAKVMPLAFGASPGGSPGAGAGGPAAGGAKAGATEPKPGVAAKKSGTR